MASGEKKERDMGLQKTHFFGVIRIDLRIEKRLLQGRGIHELRSDVKCQITNFKVKNL
jgi:hypothetical protein